MMVCDKMSSSTKTCKDLQTDEIYKREMAVRVRLNYKHKRLLLPIWYPRLFIYKLVPECFSKTRILKIIDIVLDDKYEDFDSFIRFLGYYIMEEQWEMPTLTKMEDILLLNVMLRFNQLGPHSIGKIFGDNGYHSVKVDYDLLGKYAGDKLRELVKIKQGIIFKDQKRKCLEEMIIDLAEYTSKRGQKNVKDPDTYKIKKIEGKVVKIGDSWTRGEWDHQWFSFSFIIDKMDKEYQITIFDGSATCKYGEVVRTEKSLLIPITFDTIKLTTDSITFL